MDPPAILLGCFAPVCYEWTQSLYQETRNRKSFSEMYDLMGFSVSCRLQAGWQVYTASSARDARPALRSVYMYEKTFYPEVESSSVFTCNYCIELGEQERFSWKAIRGLISGWILWASTPLSSRQGMYWLQYIHGVFLGGHKIVPQKFNHSMLPVQISLIAEKSNPGSQGLNVNYLSTASQVSPDAIPKTCRQHVDIHDWAELSKIVLSWVE